MISPILYAHISIKLKLAACNQCQKYLTTAVLPHPTFASAGLGKVARVGPNCLGTVHSTARLSPILLIS